MPLLKAGSRHRLSIVINGRRHTAYAEPRMLLSDFLRDEIGQTGTHVGCEDGVCGTCTIHVDGMAVRSCLMFAVQVDGRRIDTVEGLAAGDGRLSALQQAFRKHHAVQCGFCTAGILMSLGDYLQRHPNAGEEELRQALSGHLCRCTGYAGIIQAALSVARDKLGHHQKNP
jgi:2-furoyl-CoA dehydrogenase 2Fe-2S iron sulfur subunit